MPNAPGGADNVRMQETRAYGLLIDGDAGSALEILRRVGQYDATYTWEKNLLERAASVEAVVASGDLDRALDQLMRWRSANFAELGIALD